MKERSAVVIGGGLGGLAVALRLASRRWRVSLYEQAENFGGKMNHWRKDGFCFDTGPSLITMPGVFSELFQVCGEEIEDHLEWIAVEPMGEYVFDDGMRLRVSSSLPEWFETLKKMDPGDVKGFLDFMRLGSRLFELSAHTFFRRSPWEPPDWDSLSGLRHIPLRRGWGNYARTIDAFFRSPYLRTMYDRFPTYVGSSPYRSPATLMIIPYLEHAFGGWSVRGGLYRIIEALVGLCERSGVHLERNQKVYRVLTSSNRVQGVRLQDGSIQACEVVVMNGDASMVKGLLGMKGAAPLAERERSLSGLVFLAGLKRRLPHPSAHTVYFSADYQREFTQLFQDRRFPEDPTVYVSIPSLRDRSIVPSEGEVLFLMANAPANDGDSWDDDSTRQAWRSVLSRLKKGGFPDFEQDVVLWDAWTPRRLAERYGMPGGAIYGAHSHGWRYAFLRSPNKSRRYHGLYCVGGSTHPGGGTPTVLISARITSALISRYEEA